MTLAASLLQVTEELQVTLQFKIAITQPLPTKYKI